MKHQAFHEEREVRAITFPMTPEIEDSYREVDPAYVSPDTPMKTVLQREDGVFYIETLNCDEKSRLPIKRIIVGPQVNIDKATSDVRLLVKGLNIKVRRSETPLIW
jgi:hypothetical protein